MINVQFLDMPVKTKAISTKNEDNTYTIFLNSRLNYEQNVKSYIHELNHIVNEDHDKYDVNLIEVQAHRNNK